MFAGFSPSVAPVNISANSSSSIQFDFIFFQEFSDKIKELEHEVSELKLEVSNRNSDLLNKDKEIGELKNKLLVEKKNRMSVEEKDMLKSRIRELMARLDTHLESQTSNNF